MSLARRKRDRILAAQTITAAKPIHASAALVRGAALAPAAVTSPAAGANTSSTAARAEREIALRLTHDLRRLHEIKSIDRKIAAKREMIPEYVAWVRGVLEANAGVGTGTAANVVPTIMVWLLDIGEYADALDLVPFLLRHKVEMPGRYKRDVATVVAEIIADAAAKVQNAGEAFPRGILYDAQRLTGALDMHDEVRAKLMKAIGVEELRDAEDMEAGPAARTHLTIARNTLRDAQRLNDRVGVKDRIKRAEKLIAANLAAFPPEPETEQGGESAA